jgi:PhoH-like ATPase
MSLIKSYTGVKVVESFNKVNELYANEVLDISETNIEESLNKNEKLYPNQCLVLKDGNQSVLGIVKKDQIKLVDGNQSICKIKPKSKEQSFLMELLNDSDVDLLTISGAAGSGKTLLATAYAWQQFSKQDVDKIILVKSLTAVGQDIGFLKGSLKEKVLPWLGNYLDSFEVLGVPDYVLMSYIDTEQREKNRDPRKIEITPVTFIQGRSIRNAVMLIDEAANLDSKVVSQIVTRAGEGTKVILLGDFQQIFSKGLTSTKNGLAEVIEAGKESDIVGHITLLKSQRSRLSQWAVDNL